MKRQPYSALGYHIKRRREQHLLRRRKLARLIGFTDSKQGSVAIRMLEEEGTIEPPDLLERVAVVLHIDAPTIQHHQEQDWKAAGEWLRKMSEPIKPYLGVNSSPMPCMSLIPDEIIDLGFDAVESYGREFARANHILVYAMLSRRIRLEFDRGGELLAIRESGREDELQK